MSFNKSIFGFTEDDALLISIREIDYRGKKLKVRIPLQKEYEKILSNIQNVADSAVEVKYQELVSMAKSSGEELTQNENGEYLSGGEALKPLAKKSLSLEANVLEHFKLLIPAEDSCDEKPFDMKKLTNQMIDEQFPKAVQYELLMKIQKSLQPNYEDAKKN